MALNISLPSTAITELESYRWYDAAGLSLKDVQTSIFFTSQWVDVSDWTKQITIQGSVTNQSGEPGVNTANIELDNEDKRFSDLFTTGPYYGNLLPGKQVKLDLSVANTIVTIFKGRVDSDGFVETRFGNEGAAYLGVADGADWLEKKKFDKDYYYTDKKLIGTSTGNSLLHILLETHGGLQTSTIIANGELSINVPYTVFKEGESVQYRIRELARGCLAQYCGFRYDGKFVMESRLVPGWSVPASEYTLTAEDLEVNLNKSLSALLGNRVKVRGDKVDFVSTPIVVWEYRKLCDIGKNAVYPGWCWDSVATGDFFLSDPAATPVKEFWAQYEVEAGEIIHTESLAMSQTIYEGVAFNLNTTGTDLDAEETRGKLVLQNSQPQSVTVMNLQITGKAAIRRSIGKRSEADIAQLKLDQGISDDDLAWGLIACDSNASSISAYGQTDLVISSEYIVDPSQMISILDWHLKYGKDPKHRFAVADLPFLAFVQPGANLMFDLSDLGYSALAEVSDFSHQITPEGAKTVLTLVETPTGWTVSSAAAVRQIIAAPVLSKGSIGGGQVGAAGLGGNAAYTFATLGSTVPADAICDGAADEVEILYGQDYLLSTYGGGALVFAPGQYNISSIISIASNIEIRGNGPGTVFNNQVPATTPLFSLSGISVGNTIQNAKLRNFAITGETNYDQIYAVYADEIDIDSITINDCGRYGIFLNYTRRFRVTNNIIKGDLVGNISGIAISNSIGSIVGNRIMGLRNDNICGGILIDSSSDIIIQENYVYDILASTSSSILAFGIEIERTGAASSYRNMVQGNRIEKVKHNISATSAYGIRIDSSTCINTMVGGNVCFNNGADTGIANANRNNFYDDGTDTQIG